MVNKSTFNHPITLAENLELVIMDNKIIQFDSGVGDTGKLLLALFVFGISYINERFLHGLASKPGLLENMDTANLSLVHLCYVAERKISGIFFNETDGHTLTEFCALRTKSHTYTLDRVEKIKVKDIRCHVVKNHITFNGHKQCLFGDVELDARIGIMFLYGRSITNSDRSQQTNI
ncbi:Hypothetical protein CINCED_3A012426 [Cinara cedri]|uniref:Uncharacterized protein n=1 Tax=Cinara cedri TaxID=506608 RepID=A0A5E4MS81_9HEMI|nr:Hypothetical protein CINCED_3A012426 [Cinara cedri]